MKIGKEAFACGICKRVIDLDSDSFGTSWVAPYWQRLGLPTESPARHKKWCKRCVTKEVRSVLGNDDSVIKRRFKALIARKHALNEMEFGNVTFRYEREDTDDEAAAGN